MKNGTSLPKEKRKLYEDCCSEVFRRNFGAVDVTIVNPMPFGHARKTRILCAEVQAKGSPDTPTVNIPNKVVIKRYIPGVAGVSDTGDASEAQYRMERYFLRFDISVPENGGRRRVYPRLYNDFDSGLLDNNLVILREYVPKANLESMAREEGDQKVSWESGVDRPAISSALYPIALLHVKTPDIETTMKDLGLLKFGKPQEVDIEKLTEEEALRFIRRFEKLSQFFGYTLSKQEKGKLEEAVQWLHLNYISRREQLTIVDGELDVFPHHAMLTRLLDAGGIEVGGIARDLAIYSSPVFKKYWDSPEQMAKVVVEAYFRKRGIFEEALKRRELTINKDSLAESLLLTSGLGNIRAAAAGAYYNPDTAEREIKENVANSVKYLEAFSESHPKTAGDPVREILRIIEKRIIDKTPVCLSSG
ncbi:hypothetical protein HYW76_03845 [Candidatus Pacearchaeota archaeon]|nr:hypothetical protein [Candidatus Pacearchaeota archaeon]